MIRPNEIQSVAATVTVADAAVGSNIPQNMFRYVYKVKVTNLNAGPNLVSIGKRENGAGATTNLDNVQATLVNDLFEDGDLKEDAVPLYVIGGAGAVGVSTFRAVCSAGTAMVTVWYKDAPSE